MTLTDREIELIIQALGQAAHREAIEAADAAQLAYAETGEQANFWGKFSELVALRDRFHAQAGLRVARAFRDCL